MDILSVFHNFCTENNLSIQLSHDMPLGYETAYGTYDVTVNTLFLNMALLKDAPEYEVLFFLFHELRHAVQYHHPELFEREIQESRFYVILYNGICYKLVENTWIECALEGSEDYFTRAYMSLPYELDANTFAYEKTKEICGDSEPLRELYGFWIPRDKMGYEELRKIFERIAVALAEPHRKYYEAYEERYKTAHSHGVSWSIDVSTPIVMEVIDKYNIKQEYKLLEIGCGEGRDSKSVLERGFPLMATDISKEAIAYCKKRMPQYENHFSVLDCLSDKLDIKFDFIFGIAVIHMLVPDEDRDGFYQFIRKHLSAGGIALICTMGDGELERQSDISTAFTLQERNHEAGKMMVAGTSCRMVSWNTFEKELARNGFTIMEKGITSALPNFDSLMYAVVG